MHATVIPYGDARARALTALLMTALLMAAYMASGAFANEAATLEILPPLAPDLSAEPVDAYPSEIAPPDGAVADQIPLDAYDAASLSEEPPPIEDGPIVSLTESDEALDLDVQTPVVSDDLGYHTLTNSMNWIIGHNDQFGWVSLESSATLPRGENDGVVFDFGFHFLDGPVQTDMPPRLFDFLIGYQRRRWISPNVGYDAVAHVGVFTDFEGSARKGVRFPGHVVAQFHMTPASDWLLGIEVLDRDDVSLLPVAGIRWTPNADWRLELVFPRPSVSVSLPEGDLWAYLRGELGGDTWAIERVDLANDNATYRDFRLAFGVERRSTDGGGGTEIAYVFGRNLSYRSGVGDLDLPDAVMLGFVARR